ncbi:ABC transporter family protein [Clostridioides difficile CD45]|uniref:ATP-binding cassette domain-containing protein n=1 Tax=Clostridioides difficile TaxID=1496 RepID=UPI00038D6519|nr:ATP-binding cassette domain-containing protein [Clostridioides difficile]EQE59239.1 ABC transporter family protein [Clostridioides difficile CD45]
MSLLKVTNLSQCFMDKSLYEKANFDLFKGEHIGVVGQNGTGKSTLIKILLGEVVPDSGEIKWQPNINIGHLDQYAEINRDTTISLYLHTAFEELYKIEKEMNLLYQKSAISENGQYLIKASDYQEQLIANNFYSIDNEINKIANGLGLDSIGMNRVVGELSGGQRAKVILANYYFLTMMFYY